MHSLDLFQDPPPITTLAQQAVVSTRMSQADIVAAKSLYSKHLSWLASRSETERASTLASIHLRRVLRKVSSTHESFRLFVPPSDGEAAVSESSMVRRVRIGRPRFESLEGELSSFEVDAVTLEEYPDGIDHVALWQITRTGNLLRRDVPDIQQAIAARLNPGAMRHKTRPIISWFQPSSMSYSLCVDRSLLSPATQITVQTGITAIPYATSSSEYLYTSRRIWEELRSK